MLTLTYTSDAGRSVRFGTSAAEDTPYLLTGARGLHGLAADIHTLAQYPLDGEQFILSQIKGRTIRLEGVIARGVAENRIALLAAVDPTQPGRLTLTRGGMTRQIRCHVGLAPTFDILDGALFALELYAPAPHWEDPREERTAVAAWEGGYAWPVSIPSGGFSFGRRTQSHIVRVRNGGDVPVGMRVIFLARGTVDTPSLVHAVTYAHITVRARLSSGDRVTVSTGRGEKSVRLIRADGTEENAFALLDPDSAFLTLSPGENLFRHDAEEGIDRLDVLLYHRAQYLGV